MALITTLSAVADQHWRYELGGASLVRKAPWYQQSTQQRNVPMFSARYGGWHIGTGNSLISYHWRWSLFELHSGVGLRDESVNSEVWGDADDKRYKGFDGGGLEATANVGLTWRYLDIDIAQDISGQSNGTTIDTNLTMPLFLWPGRFTPKAQWILGGRWLSQSYSQSVYGVEQQDATDILTTYQSKDAINPMLGLKIMWPFTSTWQMRFKYHAEWLDQVLQDSPLVERNVQHSAFLTFVYLGL